MARELTKTEMQAIADAISEALPTDCKDMAVVAIVSCPTDKGQWINSMSNVSYRDKLGLVEKCKDIAEHNLIFGKSSSN